MHIRKCDEGRLFGNYYKSLYPLHLAGMSKEDLAVMFERTPAAIHKIIKSIERTVAAEHKRIAVKDKKTAWLFYLELLSIEGNMPKNQVCMNPGEQKKIDRSYSRNHARRAAVKNYGEKSALRSVTLAK